MASVLITDQISEVTTNLFVGSQIFLLLGVAPFVLTYNAVADPEFARRVAFAFLGGQSLSSAVALMQLGFALTPSVTGRYSGLAEHVNTLGFMTAIAILVSIEILIVSPRFRLLAIAALLLNGIGLVASGSLSSVLAAAVGCLVVVLSRRKYLGRILVGGLFTAAAFLVVVNLINKLDYFPSLVDRYMQVTGQTRNPGSWDIRTQTYELAFEALSEDAIFGRGVDHRFSGILNDLNAVHNSVLRAWYQGGVFLGVAFAAVSLALVVVVLKAVFNKQWSCEASVIAAFLVYSSVSPVLEQRQFWLPVLIAWASMSVGKLRHQSQVAGMTRRRKSLVA